MDRRRALVSALFIGMASPAFVERASKTDRDFSQIALQLADAISKARGEEWGVTCDLDIGIVALARVRRV